MARKYQYINKLNEIKELKQQRLKEPLVDLAIKLGKQINQRFYRLEKAGIGLGDTAYRYAQEETGKDKPRYSVNRNVLSKMTNEELYEQLLDINRKLVSPTSTITGLIELEKRRIEASREALEYEIGDDIDYDRFRDFLKNGGGEFLNHFKKYGDSNQIVDDWNRFTKSGKVSNKEFMREFTRFKNMDNFDYGRVTRNLNNLLARKTNPKGKAPRKKRARR